MRKNPKTIGEILTNVDKQIRANVTANPTTYPVRDSYIIGKMISRAMFGKAEIAYADNKQVSIGELSVDSSISRNELQLMVEPQTTHPLVKDAHMLCYKLRQRRPMVPLDIKTILDNRNRRHQHICGLKLDDAEYREYTVEEFIDFAEQVFWVHAERQLKAVCTIADLREELGASKENEIMAAYQALFGSCTLKGFSEACFNDTWVASVKSVYAGHLKHGGYDYPTRKSAAV